MAKKHISPQFSVLSPSNSSSKPLVQANQISVSKVSCAPSPTLVRTFVNQVRQSDWVIWWHNHGSSRQRASERRQM
ncbi:hypothetical protein DAI22_12g159700 [Oryza sativa Japonica Group]|nr:hypothetical protein DAI22_12g159700 [Oryza sativa Japonica Group]